MRCKLCINSSENPSRTFDENGVCNVCREFKTNFSQAALDAELSFLKTLIRKDGSTDCLVALSGGKDSAAALYTVRKMGFHPKAFTFDAGYNVISDRQREKIKNVTQILKVPHAYIDARPYISEEDRESFRMTAEFYDSQIEHMDSETVLKMFRDERHCNRPKDKTIRPFVRPCRLCRRAVIRGYYAEAVRHHVSVVFLGINEWCGVHQNNYTAVRKLEPVPGKPVYIVHLPFLIHRKMEDLVPILRKIGWSEDDMDIHIGTGRSGCLLARIAESKATGLLGFNPDETRLAREVTVGFIHRAQALNAVSQKAEPPDTSMMDILISKNILPSSDK